MINVIYSEKYDEKINDLIHDFNWILITKDHDFQTTNTDIYS